MTEEIDPLRYGYWPHRQLSGDIPSPIRNVDDYHGGETLNIACTQTGLGASRQRRLVDQWVNALPSVPATTVMFSSKVSQELFEAACQAPNLEALSIKWSSITQLNEVRRANKLHAFFLGSSPAISDLQPLSSLKNMRHLFIQNVSGPVDLEFLKKLTTMVEFGLSAGRGRRIEVTTLEPIASLTQIEMLWLVRVKIAHGGLGPLYSLPKLKSLRSTFRRNSKAFRELCVEVPTLRYFESVG